MRVPHVAIAFAAALPFADAAAAQSPWQFLQKKYDKDGDSAVTPAEYDRGADRFAKLDRNADGRITASDFEKEADGGPPRGYMLRLWSQLGRTADLNHDGQVPPAEWRTFVGGLPTGDDGVLGKTALPFLQNTQGIARRAPRMFDADKDGDLTPDDLDALFGRLDVNGDGTLQRAELGTHPIVGELAPDFELPLLSDTKTKVRLSSFRGKQPVGLIFGSYT